MENKDKIKIPPVQLAAIRLAFVIECYNRGKDPQKAAEYFDQRAIEEGWTQQNENKL